MIGKKFDSNRCGSFTVLSYSGKIAKVVFEDGTKVDTYVGSVKAGTVRNPNHPSVYGAGYTGIGNFCSVNANKEYNLWKDVIRLCYSKKFQDSRCRSVSYTMDERWLNFQNFCADVHGILNFDRSYGAEGWVFDKDVLVSGNTHCSLETMCFIPKEIDNLFRIYRKFIRKLPVGVQPVPKSSKFTVRCRSEGKNIHRGTFESVEDAKMSYKEFKKNEILKCAEKYKNCLDPRVYNSLIKLTD